MKVLADSDFLVALFKKDDSNHKRALKLANKIREYNYKVYCSNLVVQESTTVISKKIGMEDARAFYNNMGKVVSNFIIFDIKIEKKSWAVFFEQTKKGTSFVDCSNLAVLEEYNLDKIASFDGFYLKKLLLK